MQLFQNSPWNVWIWKQSLRSVVCTGKIQRLRKTLLVCWQNRTREKLLCLFFVVGLYFCPAHVCRASRGIGVTVKHGNTTHWASSFVITSVYISIWYWPQCSELIADIHMAASQSHLRPLQLPSSLVLLSLLSRWKIMVSRHFLLSDKHDKQKRSSSSLTKPLCVHESKIDSLS